MQNYIITKTDNSYINKLNTINLITLTVFLIYLFSITLAPIANSIITARNNNLFINQKSSIHSYSQALKLKTNIVTIINTVTYINQGQMISRQIDDNNLQNYTSDAKGSVLKLNSLDKSQDQLYSYDAYGKPIINKEKSNPTLNVSNPFQYNGERFDNNTNLQYLRARFYNPETKRFINQDTYDLLNRLGYVNGNPVIYSDPMGHDTVLDLFKDHWVKIVESVGSALTSGAIIKAVSIGIKGATSIGREYFYNKKIINKANSITQQLKESDFATNEIKNNPDTGCRALRFDGMITYQAFNHNKLTVLATKALKKLSLAPAHGSITFGLSSESEISRLVNKVGIKRKDLPANVTGCYVMDYNNVLEGMIGIEMRQNMPIRDKFCYIDYSAVKGLNRAIAFRAVLAILSPKTQPKYLPYSLRKNCQYYLFHEFLPEYINQAEMALSKLNKS